MTIKGQKGTIKDKKGQKRIRRTAGMQGGRELEGGNWREPGRSGGREEGEGRE